MKCIMCNNKHPVYEIDTHQRDRGVTICRYCTAQKPSSVYNAYNFNPRYLTKYTDNYCNSKNVPELFAGIEIEIECGTTEHERLRKTLSNKHWYFKHDGSLQQGFEIVTYPMTFDYIRANKEVFDTLFDKLKNNNCAADATDTCGMHIHVSKRAIDKLHLWKMLQFFKRFKKFVLAISQRDKEFIERWATLKKINKRNISQMAKSKSFHDGSRREKYVAINLTKGETIEFRIFHGTIKPEVFKKNLEFVESLIEWSRYQPAMKITLTSYFNYLKQNQMKYANLVEFIASNKLAVVRKKKSRVLVEGF